MNTGCAAFASESVTRGAPSSACVHAWLSVSPASGSALALPSSVTSAPSRTLAGDADATATGASFAFASVTRSAAVTLCARAIAVAGTATATVTS